MTPLTTGCHLGVLTKRESKEALTICTTVQGARCVCEEASATSATSQHRRRGTLPLSTRSQPYDVDHPIVQDPSCPSLGTGQPAEVAPLADKRGELGAAWTALSIYHARRSDHSRQVLCRPLRSISTSDDGYSPRLCISEGAQKNRVVGAHRREWGCEEAHRALLYLPPVLPRGCASRVDQNQEKLSRTHPRSRPTLRTAGSLQGVPPSCCGRRVAVWSGACSNRPSRAGKRHDTQAACEPGGRGCGGVPVHPARLHTHRTSPAQALLTILARHAEPNA